MKEDAGSVGKMGVGTTRRPDAKGISQVWRIVFPRLLY